MNLKEKPLLTVGRLATGTAVFGCLVGCLPVKAEQNGPVAGAPVTTQDAATVRAQLREKIKVGGDYSESKYSFASWMNLRMAMTAARQVADKENSTTGELQTATANVQAKIAALEARKVVPDASPRLALSASLFATAPKGTANNVALLWGAAEPQDSFEIHRARGRSKNFTKIYSGNGVSFNDYDLLDGTYSYKLVAYRGGKTVTSNTEQVTTMALPASVQEYSNQTGLGTPLGEPLKIKGLYYRFPWERDGDALKAMWVETSRDGKNWERGAVVMDRTSHPDLNDTKFEAVSFFYDQKRDRVVMWGHWEKAKGYSSGRAIVATAKPGERFTVHHIYNPLGIEVRDMSVFRDEDGQGYLVAASNVAGQGANATLVIFKLNDDYTDVTGITNKVMENGYREAPHIIKTGGFYYLFFSQAAGWYPSRAGYVSSTALDGRWTDARDIGNTSTFSAQSGGILHFGNGKQEIPVMQANRWIRGEGTSPNVMLPVHTAQGFAFTDYSPTLLADASKNVLIPLQAGTLLSQGQPATASIPGTQNHEVGKAFDGDYSTSFQSDDKKWPFSVTTDLGVDSKVRNVQLSWHIHKGSEAYYKYTIEGSTDGQEWRTLLNRTDEQDTVVSKTYGFSSLMLPDAPAVRYVRINVLQAVLHNNPNNWYPPTLYEAKVYGEKVR